MKNWTVVISSLLSIPKSYLGLVNRNAILVRIKAGIENYKKFELFLLSRFFHTESFETYLICGAYFDFDEIQYVKIYCSDVGICMAI